MTETIREKITSRLDQLEADLKVGKHLLKSSDEDGIREVLELILSVGKFTRVLTEDEKDFVQCAMIALTEQKPWA